MKPAKTTAPGYRTVEDALAGLERGDFPRDHLLWFQVAKKWTQALWAKNFKVEHSTASRQLDRLLQLGLIWRGPRITVEGYPGAAHVYYLSALGGRVLQRITTNTSTLGIRAASGVKDAHDLAILSLAIAGNLFSLEDVTMQTRREIPVEWRTWRWAMAYRQARLDWEAQQQHPLEAGESLSECPVPSEELKLAYLRARTAKPIEDWLLDFRPTLVTLMPDLGWHLELGDDVLELMFIEVETTTDYKHILQKYQQLIKVTTTVLVWVRIWVLVVFPSQAVLERGRRWHEMAFWRAGGQPAFYSKTGAKVRVCLTTLPTALEKLKQGNVPTAWEAGTPLEPKPINRMQWTLKTKWGRR